MYLKTDKLIVTIQDVIMRSSSMGSSGYQFILDPTAMIGWTDGVDVHRGAVQRPTYHGNFPETSAMNARTVSISGVAIAGTVLELKRMRDKLVGLLIDGKYQTIKVEDAIGTRYGSVGLEGKTSWVQQSDTVATWRLSLYMPDPMIYGESKRIQINEVPYKGGMNFPLMYPLSYNSPGIQYSEAITNEGNMESWPIYEVTGNFPRGFMISHNGNIIQFDGMVTMSSPVVIQSALGNAEQSGVDRTELLSRRDWFSIAPGGAIRPAFASIENGPGWCDIIYRDTWI